MLSVQLYDIWTPDVQQKRNGMCCGVETRVYTELFLYNLEWKLTATIVKYWWIKEKLLEAEVKFWVLWVITSFQ